VAKNVKGNVIA